jgi:hypothetical protein
MYSDETYKKRKYMDGGYGAATKKQNKLKDEDGKATNKENNEDGDPDSDMELEQGIPGGKKGQKSLLNKAGKGKMKMLKTKRGRKYKLMKEKNLDPGQPGKYKRKKLQAPIIQTIPAELQMTPDGVPLIPAAPGIPPTAASIQKRAKGKDRNVKSKTKKNKMSSNETQDEEDVCSEPTCARPTGEL